MDPISIVVLFGVMVALAAMPSSSVLLVVARSISAGTVNGLAVAAGIVAGDLVFVMLALLGLNALAEAMGGLFVIIKMLGAAWLIYLGYRLFVSNDDPVLQEGFNRYAGIAQSFLAGLVLTLGDLKAIVFYASLLPLFVEISALGSSEITLIVLITIVAVGGVKVFYAVAAQRLVSSIKSTRAIKPLRQAAGVALIGAGGYIVAKP